MATGIDDLPSDLQEAAKALLRNNPESASLLVQLGARLVSEAEAKKREPKLKVVSKYVLKNKRRIPACDTIFQLNGLSSFSPLSRKMRLVFHLHVCEDIKRLVQLSVVDATSEIPELTLTDLLSATELCMMIPILGNSTVSEKKDTVMMVLWFKDAAAITEGQNEPILFSLDLDVVKKQLTDAGKIPPHAEAQFLLSSTDNEAVKPFNELIIDFLQRQFGRLGVKLINLLPSVSPDKNSFNMNDDDVICLSQNADTHNDLVMAAAWKGSKKGGFALVANSGEYAFLVFGFYQPDFLIKSTIIKAVSYSSITRLTFSMWVTVVDTDGKEISHGFAMIDQKSFQAIDDFVKRMNLNDNCFDENQAVEGDAGNAEAAPVGSDDEEEDGTSTGAVEEEGSGSGSEVDEEFDSNVESDSQVGESHTGKRFPPVLLVQGRSVQGGERITRQQLNTRRTPHNAISDECTNISDADDSFKDHISEELETLPECRKTLSPQVELGALAQVAEPEADQKNNTSLLDLNETEYRDDQATGADIPKEDMEDKSPMKTRPGRISASPPMDIPSIFLLEGDKNRRILLRDQEIAKQLQEEDDKNSKRSAALESERHKFLEELNDNGSNYVYSWKNDAQIIDDYVQKSLSHDPDMETSRQFYFFDNQERVSVGESFAKATPTLLIALRFLSGTPDRFLHNLEASLIPFLQFVFAALLSIFDLDSLAFVERVACRAFERWRTARSEETENDSKTVNCPSITELMRAIGARIGDPNKVMEVSLRIVHYDNHLSLHVLRLSILFRVYLPRANTRDDFVLLFQYFYLACSDFHINNLERGYLQRTLVGPIFELFIDIWSLKFGAESFLDDVHSILSLVLPTLYADNEIQIQKKLEMHYNMLLNLCHLIPPLKPSAELVNRLVYKFLEFDNDREILAQVAKTTEKLSRLSVSSTVDGMEIDRAGVYKNFYKAELISMIIVSHVLVEFPLKSKEFLACFERFQECKDSYQLIIGQLSFLTSENMRDKIRLTLFLGDTYHSLDYSATLLSKSDMLPDRDFFYE